MTVQVESKAVTFNPSGYDFMLKLHIQQKRQFVLRKAEALVMKANYLYGFHLSATSDFLALVSPYSSELLSVQQGFFRADLP